MVVVEYTVLVATTSLFTVASASGKLVIQGETIFEKILKIIK